MQLRPGNLVRWANGPTADQVGVVVEAGNVVRVHFDSGVEHQFSASSDAIQRLAFDKGDQVELLADGVTGVVTSRQEVQGRYVYTVSLPAGPKTILEDGVRVAMLSDPIALWKAGHVHETRSCNLRLTATRLLFAHQFDELSSLSNSRVEIKPHQVAVLHRVSTSYPHRFLLADEVGLGKTIEAGLIVRELRARGVVKRVLVLAPSGIARQWQFELRTKFNEVFALYRADSVAFLEGKHPGENVWTVEDNVITSTSYAVATEERMREIALAGWDMIIIDEAHHARRQLQSESKRTQTRLYDLAELLADPETSRGQAMLLLTATPMQLDTFELYSLIELLDPALFPDFRDFEQHRSELSGLNRTVDAVRRWLVIPEHERSRHAEDVARWLGDSVPDQGALLSTSSGRAKVSEELLSKHRLSDVMLRNRKVVVGGFTVRKAVVWPVEMTKDEWNAYDAIGAYVRSGYAHARAIHNNALGFLMTTFQKLSSSSSFALRQSLLRRIEKLEAGFLAPTLTDVDESDLEERPAADALGESIGVRYRDAVATELKELAHIVGLIDRIPLDSKARVLRERLSEILEQEMEPKVLIFTQSRDTQEYLRSHLGDPWSVNLFHGQLKPDAKDAAVDVFRTHTGPQLLISTEAGGEGRNFQFCHIVINYDLPWNPMKIEQRIGRLDRIGQKHPVTIINFAIRGTIEERVLQVVAERIRVFEETIGGLDPILGDVEQDLREVFLSSKKEQTAALARLEQQLEDQVRDARDAERRLADLIMDTKSFRQDEVRELLDRRSGVDHVAVRRFVINALAELDVEVKEDVELRGVYDLRLRGQFVRDFPHFAQEGLARRVTFSPTVALDLESVDFLAFGHEIVDALVARIRSKGYRGHTSHRVVRTNDQTPVTGWFFAYVLEFEGVVRSKEVYPVFVDSTGVSVPSTADWILDRALRGKRENWGKPEEIELQALDGAASLASTAALDRLLARKDELTAANLTRVEQERDKLRRYYEYRTKAAEDRVESVRRIYERVRSSLDPGEQRIVPVWAKNLENAETVLASLEEESVKRLAELSGREQVTAQHELLTVSFVQIVPETNGALI
jgi:ATP-dependent helicase HepA